MEYRQLLGIFLYLSLSTSDEPVTTTPLIVPLNGDSWIVKGIKNSTSIKGMVPGGIYTDLRNAGVLLDDIFSESNDIAYRWVAKDDWTYSTSFTVGPDIHSRENVHLVFHGVDTIASVYLNEKLLGELDNMFIRYRYDVKSLLIEGKNQLEVKFKSPIQAASDLSSKSNYVIPQTCPPDEYHGECYINFLRKMQASFAWDWGPAFPSVGIWKPVNLEVYDKVIIRSVNVVTDKIMDTWELSTTVHLDTVPNKVHSVHADLKIFTTLPHGKIHQIKFDLEPIDLQVKSNEDGEANFTIEEIFINEDYVSEWWPNGYGSQQLYTLELILKTDNKEETKETVQFGFRTVKLVQDYVDCQKESKGRKFQFEVNGIKVFSKGTNYIPAHILPELGTDVERVRTLLYSVKEANMNMVRVWGGGVYETDTFYKLCDELGIMVWQDMMFACNMYPSTDQFLKSVTKEVIQNVRRLQNHPSIVLWAGNNENEVALLQNWYGTARNFKQFKEDYVKLYGNTIKEALELADKSRPYVTSSPSNGLKTEEEGFVSSPPGNGLYGDTHEYTYYSNNWDPSHVTPSRFVSEYGVQSLPSLSTLKEASKNEEDLKSITSVFLQNRQHQPNGYQIMTSEIKMNMANPEDKDLQTFIYYSQINQAMSIKTKTEAYRRLRDTLFDGGEGLTMGAMYWQLNDVWQAPSWSSIEYGGKWKMLHYFAKDFFSQILISPWLTNNGNVAVSIISDNRSGPPLKLVLETSVYRWDSVSPVATVLSNPFRLNPLTTVKMPEVALATALDKVECGSHDEASRKCFLVFNLKDRKNTALIAPQAFIFPETINRIETKESTIRVLKVKKSEEKVSHLPKDAEHYYVTLSTDAVALFVWLDVGKIEGHFSENGFLFIPGEKTVSFTAYKPIKECQLVEALTVQTINGKFIVEEAAMSPCTLNDSTVISDEKEKPAVETDVEKEKTPEKKEAAVVDKPDEKTDTSDTSGEAETKEQETEENAGKEDDEITHQDQSKSETKSEPEKVHVESSAPVLCLNSILFVASLTMVTILSFN